MNSLRHGSCGVVLLSVFALGQGCDRQATSQPSPNQQRGVVARVRDITITAAQLQEELNSLQPVDRLRFASAERRQEFLKNLVRFEALAEEARRRGLDQDPEVVRRVKRTMVDAFLQQLRAKLVKMDEITEKDVEAYYQAQHGSAKGRLAEGERDRLRNRLFNERRDQALSSYVAQLRAKARIEIDEGKLARMRAQSSSAPVRPD